MIADPRYFQVGCLGTLLTLLLARGDPGSDPWQAPVCIAATLLAQVACCALWRLPFDWRSPLITSFSLSLLFRADTPWLWALAALLAIGSKFLVRVREKHVFNPANFAISVLLLALPDHVWVSPGQWGAGIWLAFLFAGLGLLVLQRAARLDIAAAFMLSYGGLLLMRCLSLGDPLTIPAHQLQSGALLLFAFFMITDPRATPDSRVGRIMFAAAVALLAYHLQFAHQIRPGMFLALFLLSPIVPLIDAALPAARFAWNRPKEA